MRAFLGLLILLSGSLFAQNPGEIYFGDSANFYIGSEAQFAAGGNVTFNGPLENNGTIVSFSNLDFVDNVEVGDLTFRGDEEQSIKSNSDAITVGVLTVENSGEGKVVLDDIVVTVTDVLNLVSGVLEADENELALEGIQVYDTNQPERAYIEGYKIEPSKFGDVVFPMGVGGAYNYITLSTNGNDIPIRVECRTPDEEQLLIDDETVGLARQVEWLVQTLEGEVLASVSVDFSGVDLNLEAFGDDAFIRADTYAPALQLYSPEDDQFHALTTTDLSETDDDRFPSMGILSTSDEILLTTEPKRFVIGLVPMREAAKFYVPNAFSPQGAMDDNRVFRPYFAGEEILEVYISVFDAFNNEIYRTAQTGEDLDLMEYGWDGTISGQDAPEGVYYYRTRVVLAESVRIQVDDGNRGSIREIESSEVNLTGTVMLVK